MIFSQKKLEHNLSKVISSLNSEPHTLRPPDSTGKPGGVILLKTGVTSIIVPDLHGRFKFLPDLLSFNYRDKTIQQRLEENQVQIICVGDGMHGESRVAERWRMALVEYQDDFDICPTMQEEMYESFTTMSFVMELKARFPENFHFLKGNHENVADKNENGDHSFAKFAAESRMTKRFVEKYYGLEFLNQYSRFESNLPLLAKGENYIITHSRPRETYSIDEIIDYHEHPDIIEGLTWTRNAQAEVGVVNRMLEMFLGSDKDDTIWIAGHTPVEELYKLFDSESLILLHSPKCRPVAILDPEMIFDPEKHILEIPQI